MPKIRSTSKKVSNKSCSELNFVQKSQGAQMSISSRSGVMGLFHFCILENFKCTSLWSTPPPAPLVGEVDICARKLFCTKFNSEQLLFELFLI